MKILQIGKFYPPYLFGGIETYSKNLHEALIKNNIDTDFIGFLPKSYSEDISADSHIYLCKTNIEKCSTQFSSSFVKRYKKVRNNYDIIFVNLPHPFANLILWMFPPKKNTKIVLFWHSDIIKQKFILFFYQPLLKWLIKRSSLIIAPTSIHLDESDFTKYFKNKKKVLPFILNYPTSNPPYVLTQDGKKVIFACGRLTHYKGFDVLIEAAKLISDDAVIHIAGSGQQKEYLESKIQELNLQNKVKLLGSIPYESLINEYKNCYLYCFPSTNRAEMMGLVQYEALSFSKPIVSTVIPRSGSQTINVDNVSGFKTEINNPQALAEKINLLLNDQAIYNKFSQGAEQLSLKYNDPNIINDYILSFQDLLK